MFTKKNFFTYDLLQESAYFLIIFYNTCMQLHVNYTTAGFIESPIRNICMYIILIHIYKYLFY